MSISAPWRTFKMFLSENTKSNLWRKGLNAKVSIIKSADWVDIYIKQVIPKYVLWEWCSKSIAISLTYKRWSIIDCNSISLLTNENGVSSTDLYIWGALLSKLISEIESEKLYNSGK